MKLASTLPSSRSVLVAASDQVCSFGTHARLIFLHVLEVVDHVGPFWHIRYDVVLFVEGVSGAHDLDFRLAKRLDLKLGYQIRVTDSSRAMHMCTVTEAVSVARHRAPRHFNGVANLEFGGVYARHVLVRRDGSNARICVLWNVD